MITNELFDWQATIEINIHALRLIGLWPQGDETYKKNAYTIYSAITLTILLCGHNFFQTVNIFFILDDLEAFTSSIFVTLSCIGGVLKAYSLIRNMKTLKQLFVAISDDMFQPRNSHQKTLVEPSIKFWKTIYTLLSIMCLNCGFFWTTYPILDKSDKYRLPFLAWYPFETRVSPNYEITYLYQIVCICFIVMVNLNIDMLIAALNMFIGAECDILCDNLRNLAAHEMGKAFRKCIQHHKAILEFATKCNNFYNWILLFQFFTSAVSLGFSMFRLTQVVPFTSEFYSFIVYGNAVILEIFLYCWFGNEVELKSKKIPYAIFEADWMETQEINQNLFIFTICTQKGIKLSALNLFYLTLETLKMILRTSWSYFAVLNQVNS